MLELACCTRLLALALASPYSDDAAEEISEPAGTATEGIAADATDAREEAESNARA